MLKKLWYFIVPVSFLYLILLPDAGLRAQTLNNGTIKGSLVDEHQLPLPFASVILKNASDSIIYKSTFSNDHGIFIFGLLKNGSYQLEIRMLGFETFHQKDIKVEQINMVINLGVLQLKPEVKLLSSVTINAKIPFIERRADKVVVNLDNSISAGTSLMEVMDKLPGVQVDPNDQISLNGKIVQVYIDGKATPLSSDALSSLLKGMSPANIQKIELIAHPSAKYDAAGSGGIINIIRKRNHKEGMSGNVYGGFGQGKYDKENGGLNLNYRNTWYNLLLNTNYAYNQYFLDNQLTSQFFNDLQVLQGESFSRINSTRNNRAYTPNLGIDFYLSRKTTLSLSMTDGIQLLNKDAQSYTNNSHTDGLNNSNSSFLNLVHTRTNNFSSGLHLLHQVDTTGKEYTLDFDYLNYDNRSTQNNNLTAFDSTGTLISNNQTFLDQGRNFNIYTAKADYTLPVNHEESIEAGWKSSYVVSKNSNDQYDDLRGLRTIDLLQTDRFRYAENINALYASYHSNHKRFSYNLGIRAENTWGKGLQLQTAETFRKSYFQLFPSAYFDYKINEKNSLNVTLDKKTDRPTYENLNPLVRIINSTNYRQGNPDLRPVISYNSSFTYSFKNAFFLIFDYSLHLHDFTTYSSPYNETAIITTKPSNNRHTQYFNLITGYVKQINKWWYTSSNISIRKQSSENTINGYNYNPSGRLTFNVDSYDSFTITKKFSLMILLKYRGRTDENTLVTDPYFYMAAGIKQELFGKKGSLSFNVADPLKSFKNRYTQNSIIIRQIWDNQLETTIFRLNFTYNFGGNIKKTKSGNGADNEKKRTETKEN